MAKAFAVAHVGGTHNLTDVPGLDGYTITAINIQSVGEYNGAGVTATVRFVQMTDGEPSGVIFGDQKIVYMDRLVLDGEALASAEEGMSIGIQIEPPTAVVGGSITVV